MPIQTGKNIPILTQVFQLSPSEWEDFILEWVSTKEQEYFDVERLGGAGDMGRDVVGFVDDPKANKNYAWENFQCKHYYKPLAPTDIWCEVGKVCYFSFIGEYPFPKAYYFLCPKGVGTKLSDYLRKPDLLREKLYENWDKYCLTGITDTADIDLTDVLKSYIDDLDFGVFDKIAPIKLIQDHSKTRFHVMRFNAPLPDRPDVLPISTDIQDNEIKYVDKLLKAYDSHSSEAILSIHDLGGQPKYSGHLQRSREDFSVAESLRNFSRDTLEKGEFEKIQNEVFTGVIDIAEDDHETGFDRVKAVVGEARKLPLGSSQLVSRMNTNDRSGICHQLANDDRIDWCNK